MTNFYFFKFLNLSIEISHVLTGILSLLTFFSILFFIWSRFNKSPNVMIMNKRMKSWWIIVIMAFILMFSHKIITFTGLAFISFVALRELLSSIQLRQSDRRAIFWAFLTIPIQYWAAYVGWYGFFIIFIPVIMFILLPFRKILVGDVNGITRSIGTLHWAVMLTVFSLSHIGFLFSFPPQPGFEVGNVGLVIYLVFLTEFNDVLQFLWGKSIGRHKIIPKISPNKTWEGFLGGLGCTILLAYLLRFLTFFTPTQALIAGFTIAVVGFIGDLNISAVKRDVGVKDMGNLIPGHGGIMDRIDSLSFTAMAFFHLAYFWRYVS